MKYKLKDFKSGNMVIINKSLTGETVGIIQSLFEKMQKTPQTVQKTTNNSVMIRGYCFDPLWITEIITIEKNPECFI